ncbi:MAG TPA: GNAT family N-acetyltransferase [Anaerolineales bacterium]
MKIITPRPTDEKFSHQAARLMVDAFRVHWSNSWTTLEDGMEEISEMFEDERIFRAAVDDDGNVLGIIGGIPQYDGHVWELHPLAVQPSMQGQGIGNELVKDFEEQVKLKGGITIMLGTDDEDDMTSLSTVDLYEDTWGKIQNIRNIKGHPYEFYQKMGFVITGVVPDANGMGKPDILMSKRVG